MTLSEKDGKLFYELWLPLLEYVNQKRKVNKKVKRMVNAKNLVPQEVKEIAGVLWGDVSFIDQYLNEQGRNLPGEHKEIIFGWKRRVQGRFAVIDYELVWHGGMNLLGKADAWDNLIRIKNHQAAAELLGIVLGAEE